MIELRYNGCANCRTSAKAVMARLGYFNGKDYRITYHDEHRGDGIYKKRPDYLNIFSGAILYNPDTEHWIDFYDRAHEKLVLKPDERCHKLVQDLISGK